MTSKVVGCVAAGVFLIAPLLSFNGFLLMAGSVVALLICGLAYGLAEPDEDPEELKP